MLVVMFAGVLAAFACVLVCQGVSWMNNPRWLNATTDGETNLVSGIVLLGLAFSIGWLGAVSL